MKYSQLTDRDIDRLVMNVIYGVHANDKDIQGVWKRGGFKYTSNPADAWPIIVESRISIRNRYEGDWKAENEWGESRFHVACNPLRAAMIVFLMMQEKESK